MKLIDLLKRIWIVPFLALAIIACETENEANEELTEFETWVDNTAANVEAETEEEWAETRAEYDRQVAELDAETSEWDEETRTRYESAKTRFQEREDNLRQTWAAAVVVVEVDPQMATTLIGTSDFSTITAQNIKEKYQMLLQKTRELDDQWTDADWERADAVMDRLDERREELDVPAEDVTRIIAWKGEYNVLKAGDEISGN